MSIVHVLVQFIFRATFGVALAMGLTSSRFVTSGFFRVHLWVLMGLNTMAALAIATSRETFDSAAGGSTALLSVAIALAIASYFGAVTWLYEAARAGKVLLGLITVGGIAGAVMLVQPESDSGGGQSILAAADAISSGAVIGSILTAMFLGHWYLNTPTMDLRPLKKLVIVIALTIAARALVNGFGLVLHLRASESIAVSFWIFVALRWIAGLIVTALLALMTWYSLKIPNTQSATGILYAGVILAFIGELTSQFLSSDAAFPL